MYVCLVRKPGWQGKLDPDGKGPVSGGGMELTLSELQEMAARQQGQIEAQQQTLVAKEQRLKFLKQQELRHQQIAAENERLRKLREKVEQQELKLKKLRALRGQVNEQRGNNNGLSAELETIKALFNEKEKELSVAVSKVDELSHQLETQRNINQQRHSNNNNKHALAELDKLRNELMMRNKLNESQNSKLAAHREVLLQRKEEMSLMDRRIAELQSRLRKKRNQQNNKPSANQEAAVLNLANQMRSHGKLAPRPISANVAAVEPYTQYRDQDSDRDVPSSKGQDTAPDYYSLKVSHQESNMKQGWQDNRIEPTGKDDSNRGQSERGIDVPDRDLSGSVRRAVIGGERVPARGDNSVPSSVSKPWMSGQNIESLYQSSNMSDRQINNVSDRQLSNASDRPLDRYLPSSSHSLSSTSTITPPTSIVPPSSLYLPTSTHPTPTSLPYNSMPPPTSMPPPSTMPPPSSLPHATQPSYLSSPYTTSGYRPGISNLTPRPYGSTYGTSALRLPPHMRDDISGGQTTMTATTMSPMPSNNLTSAESRYPKTSTPIVGVPPHQTSIYQSRTSPSLPPHSSQSSLASASLSNISIRPPMDSISAINVTARSGDESSVGGRSGGHQIAISCHQPVLEPQHPETLPPHTTTNHTAQPYPSTVPHTTAPPTMLSFSESFSETAEDQYATEQSSSHKPDTSPTAVSSALANLKQATSPTNKPSYRYAPKSVIASTYLNRLGVASLDKYKQNMNELYKDFITTQTYGGAADDVNVSADTTQDTTLSAENVATGDKSPSVPSTAGSPLSIPASMLSVSNSISVPSRDSDSPQGSDSPTLNTSTAPHDLDAERSHYRPNVPKLRRRSSSGEVDDMRRFSVQQRAQRLQSEEDEVFTNSSNGDVIHIDTLTASYGTTTPPHSPLSIPAEGSPDKVKPMPQLFKKTNLKRVGSVKSGRRVCFDPLALLLDASLEGELELVQRCAGQVDDPSAANDEGITALHNAICAGHYEIVKFLVEFGCNVNSPDSDGWTPLHCAASCNNLPMVKILVEHGACIFATTISDSETAAEKCEEDEDGYDGCSEYLYSIQEKLGIINKGVVYAVFDYQCENADEVTFKDGQALTVLRKGDDREKEWWWAGMGDNEGYIPRNLLGLFPRVQRPKNASMLH